MLKALSLLSQGSRVSGFTLKSAQSMAPIALKPSMGTQAAAFYEQSLLGRAATRGFTSSSCKPFLGLPSALSPNLNCASFKGAQRTRSCCASLHGFSRPHLRGDAWCCTFGFPFANLLMKNLHGVASSARSLRLNASPHHATNNLVIGPEPILKEQAPLRADSSTWSPNEEWNDVMQPPQSRLLLVDGMAVAYRAYYKVGVS
jgi:hypothetical protein